MKDNNEIKILLTEDHRIMRDGLRSLFSNYPGMKVVGEADNIENAGLIIQRVMPDVVTIGINFDGANNIETVQKLAEQFPKIRIIVHSSYIEKTFVSNILKAGMSAYVHKEEAFPELVKAIEAAMNNDIYLCPRIMNIVMDGYLNDITRNGPSGEVSLTKREREVLQLLSDGKSSKEIALILHISTKTVDTHRRQIMNKVQLYSMPELTKYAIRCGLTSIN